MNLLLLNHNLREHGTYFRAFHFGRELVRQGHQVTLLTASPDHWYRPVRDLCSGMEIIETPSWNPFFNRDDGFSPLDTLYRTGVVLRRRWDALYAFAHPPNVLVPHWLYRLVRRGRVAVDWCDLYGGRGGIVARRRALWAAHPPNRPGSWIGRCAQRMAWRIEPWAERHMARHAPRLTVISTFLERWARRLGVAPERLLRLSSGAPVDVIRPMDKTDCRDRLGIGVPPETAMLVYVANYHPDEEFLLAALRHAVPRSARETPATPVVPPNGTKGFSSEPFRPWVLYVIGPPFAEGNLNAFGLSGLVYEKGRRPFSEIATWLAAADLLLLPFPNTPFNRSRWPNKIGDYLAAGRPTITNRTGDFAPLFRHCDIGVATDSVPEAYGRALADVVAARARWGDWGLAARRLAEGPLSWSALATRLADFWLG